MCQRQDFYCLPLIHRRLTLGASLSRRHETGRRRAQSLCYDQLQLRCLDEAAAPNRADRA